MLLLGTGIYSVSNVIYSRIAIEGGYYLGHPIDLGWHAGMLAVAAAALLAGEQGADQVAVTAADEPDPSGNLRTAVIVGGSLTGTWLAAHTALTHAGEPVLAAGIALIGLIIAGRLAYSSIQSRQLRVRTRERDRLEREAAVAAATEAAAAQRAEELRIARDEALQASRLKSEFLATMSHEVRTPMHGVTGMLDLVLETPLSVQQRDFVQTAHESAQSLLAIIDDILDFSRMEAGKLILEPIDFEPTAAVEGAADVAASKAQAKGLALVTFISPEIPRVLVGDPGRLRQVLVNLIGNAVKFTDQGTIVVRAELDRAGDRDVTVRFRVSDTGIGLSAATRDRLFQPFVQADASTTRRYGGTGLGLAICKRLTELMGGEIGVESGEGQGSTFWFTARFGRSPVPALSASPRTEHALQGMRVLVVDDNSTIRDIVHRYILSWGMRNGHAGTVPEALAILRATAGHDPYDIAVVDLADPRWDEFALASAVRGDAALGSTQLILLTELDQRERGERALRAGFAAYLSKPVRQSRLFDAIVEAIAARAPFAEAREAAAIASSPAASPPVPAAAVSSRILLAEDNPVNQRVARLQLERLGYTVHTVANGREAVEALATDNDYTLVLMDVQMPEMDGLAATEAIRAAEAQSGRRVPIIAMTANAMEGDRNTCLAAGMDDYISKPVNRDRLRQVLADWMPRAAAEQTAVDR